ncbi:MAG: hypothetical protein VW080_00995 [Flavobacteriaceae bacterium]
MRYKFMDLKPYIYKTDDYGASWKSISEGIQGAHNFARVVREDKKVPGLLYAGTETGLYVSQDDGESWHSMQTNLPIVPINDLYIQDNDLIAATAGRSFWILDDLSSLQEYSQVEGMHLVTPKKAYRLFSGKTPKKSNQGTNPFSGVVIDYFLPKKVDSLTLRLEILEGDTVIRSYTSEKPAETKTWPGGPSPERVLTTHKGHNRTHWDFRRKSIIGIDEVFVYGSYAGSAVGPGEFSARLSYGSDQMEVPIRILPNPNIETTAADFEEQQKLLVQIDGVLTDIHKNVVRMRSVQSQLQHYAKVLQGRSQYKTLLEKANEIEILLNAWESDLIQSDQKTFQDVINFNNKLNAEWMNLKSYVDAEDPKVTQGARDRFADLMEAWKQSKEQLEALIAKDFKEFEDAFQAAKVPALVIPD